MLIQKKRTKKYGFFETGGQLQEEEIWLKILLEERLNKMAEIYARDAAIRRKFPAVVCHTFVLIWAVRFCSVHIPDAPFNRTETNQHIW